MHPFDRNYIIKMTDAKMADLSGPCKSGTGNVNTICRQHYMRVVAR